MLHAYVILKNMFGVSYTCAVAELQHKDEGEVVEARSVGKFQLACQSVTSTNVPLNPPLVAVAPFCAKDIHPP